MNRFALLTLTLLSLPAAAQSTLADLQARLMHKPLYLRGQWSADKLRFDNTGHLLGTAQTLPFTVSGIDVKDLTLKNGGLRIEGTRAGLRFDNDKITMVHLTVGTPGSEIPESIRIDIQSPPSGDYAAALDAIFTAHLADFVSTLPIYWRQYGRDHFLPPAATPSTGPVPSQETIYRIGGSVSPPLVLSAPEPEFPPQARGVKLRGGVLVYLQVEPDGRPTHLRILRPLGLGLDEKAVEAVSRYHFKPARQNGVPVTVEMNVEVNFQII